MGTVICIVGMSFYVVKAQKNEEIKLQDRARIISPRVWANDRVGMVRDLNLIAAVEKYKYLEVIGHQKNLYVSVKGAELVGFDAFLHKIGLIRKKNINAIVFHKDGPIGSLQGEKYLNIFIPSLLCFGGLVVLIALCIIILSLISMKKNLRKDLEKQQLMLKESDSRFKELVNQLPEIVWETDRYGKIEYANNLAHERFSISRVGETFFFDLFHKKSSESIKENFEKIISGQSVALQELLACDYKNVIFPVLLKCSPRYSGGDIVGLRCLGMDITERVHLQKQLEHDRRVKELGMLAGGVAHDLNNMLAGVVGYSDLLLLEMNNQSREYEIIEEVHKAGLQAANVVSDLLTAVRGGIQRKKNCDVIPLLKDYFSSIDFQNLQLENPQITFVINFSVLSAEMHASPIHMRKIIMNLIINSVDATKIGGTITTAVTSLTSTVDIVCKNRNLPAGDYLCLSVKDEGIGIAVKDLDNVFEPFFSTKEHLYSGTGLGLSLVWNAVNDHEGGIQIKTPDIGCEMKIYFPCDKIVNAKNTGNVEIPQSLTLASARVTGKGERILIVDDDLRQRQLVTKILSRHGYLVVAMESGEIAVRYLRTHQVDLVILDMVMGVGIDGNQAYKKMLKLWPQQKALIVSGYASEKDVDEILSLGAYGLVNKPYTVIELVEAVAKALESDFTKNAYKRVFR